MAKTPKAVDEKSIVCVFIKKVFLWFHMEHRTFRWSEWHRKMRQSRIRIGLNNFVIISFSLLENLTLTNCTYNSAAEKHTFGKPHITN